MVLSIGVAASTLPRVLLASVFAPKGSNDYQKVTGESSEDDRSRWDALFDSNSYMFGREPALILKENIGLLPIGRALDIAMGEGRNAIFLAKKGYQVDGVDISTSALRKAARLANENNVMVNLINADLDGYKIQPESYDVILNINYLNRGLIPQIKLGLKKGGIVVFENLTVEHAKNPLGKGVSRDYLLELGELRRLFKDFEILVDLETNDGKEASASLIARKP